MWLERVGEAERRVLLELPVAQFVVTIVGIVEAREEKQVGRNVLRDLQGEGVFPINLSAVIAGETVEARLPGDGLADFPLQRSGDVGTEVGQRMGVLVGLYAEAACQAGAPHVAVVHGYGREVRGPRG